MRYLFAIAMLSMLSGCASYNTAFYSPYDLDRDGVMDARCPGMEYDTSDNTLYGWRSRGSGACENQSAAD